MTAPKAASRKLALSDLGSGGACSSVSGIRELVAGLIDGGTDVGIGERGRTGDRDGAGGEVDLHGADAGKLGDLAGHGLDAVRTGHPGHGVGAGDGHGVSFLGQAPAWHDGQERTSRAMASDASLTLAVGSPARAASTTQWAR